MAGMVRFLLIGFVAVVCLCGCNRTEKIELPAVKIQVPSSDGPTQAQPKLPTIKLWIGAAELEAELAGDANSVRTGMMFRTNLAENAGMLFVFAYSHQASFWMKNTLVPLSIGYINPEGKLLEIYDMQPLNTNSVTAKSSEVQFVLEVNQGWFERNKIKPGAVIKTPRGTLPETFFNRR